MDVFWTERARDRLRSIVHYIEQDDPNAARKVALGLLEKSRSLSDLALSGRAVPEYRRDDVRELLCRPYRLIYRIGESRIDVLTVMHYRQLLPEDFRKH